ncbi:hypothetical protein [Neomegalonema perideroedes]|uniref:hypothetical protein n=1 Tax=Neomegalonema perideroedes TaxID=217219 RepID=UPI0003671A9F|nr:hypothetical protein [Neomegalonema perideroedes]
MIRGAASGEDRAMELADLGKLIPVLAALAILAGGIRRWIAQTRLPPEARPARGPFPWGAFLRATLRHILLGVGLALAALLLFALLGAEGG